MCVVYTYVYTYTYVHKMTSVIFNTTLWSPMPFSDTHSHNKK